MYSMDNEKRDHRILSVADFLIVSTHHAGVTFRAQKMGFELISSQNPSILTIAINSSQKDSGERHFFNFPN